MKGVTLGAQGMLQGVVVVVVIDRRREAERRMDGKIAIAVLGD